MAQIRVEALDKSFGKFRAVKAAASRGGTVSPLPVGLRHCGQDDDVRMIARDWNAAPEHQARRQGYVPTNPRLGTRFASCFKLFETLSAHECRTISASN